MDKKICLKVHPRKIFSLLEAEEKERNAILLDYDADRLANGDTRLNMKVVFRPISISRKRGRIQWNNIKIGSTEAEIVVQAVNGTLRDYTPDRTIKVTQTNSKTRSKKTTFSLKPSLKVETEGLKGEAELAELSSEKGTEETSETEFENQEKELASHGLFDEIQWTVKLPRGEKAIHDYLIGNMNLFATFFWANPANGKVSIHGDIQFFDPKKGPLGPFKSRIMEIKRFIREV